MWGNAAIDANAICKSADVGQTQAVTFIGSSSDTAFKIADIGDYNAAGKADAAWSNPEQMRT